MGALLWAARIGASAALGQSAGLQSEADGVRYVVDGDRTAVFVDARPPEEYSAGSLPGARNIPLDQVQAAKDDGRLPMEDHNTRIVVFGVDAAQARAVAEAIARNAFHNVTFVADPISGYVGGPE